MKQRICHISTVHSVYDDRIFYKECLSLKEQGYDVYYIVSNNNDEIKDGIKIIALSNNDSRLYRILCKNWKALRKAISLKADIYHFHDPEFIFYAIILKILGKKVIYDVHEDVPLQILSKEWIKGSILKKIISISFNLYEKLNSRFFNAVVTVTPDIQKKFSNKNVIMLRNMPITEDINKAEPIAIKKNNPVIIYAGGLTRVRGIKELVEAVALLEDKVTLWLLGEWESDEFKKECMEINNFINIDYYGKKQLEEVYSYMKAADIGFCTLYPIKNYLTSLPVKAFEYMTCSLPMIMSNFPYWIENFNSCALFVNPKDSNDIKDKIEYLINNSDKANSLGKNGLKIIKEKYSWEAEAYKLFDLYKIILE